MKFKTKIDWWFHLVFVILLVLPIFKLIYVLFFSSHDNLVFYLILGGSFIIVGLVLVLPIYINTNYTLEDDVLHIRSGFCINRRIPYKDITMIYETRDPSASAGLSLDRISINCSKGEYLISPKEKQKFIKLLQERIE